MPNIKPLRKLVTKAREVRDHHRERHTPSGFAFALADSIDYLDREHWDKVTQLHSLYLQTHKNARLRLVTLPVTFLPTLAKTLGTALEPKARLGARPDPMRVWIRHRIPMLNLIVRGLLHTIDDHEEPPERNPFK